jgi:hypothetical protein
MVVYTDLPFAKAKQFFWNVKDARRVERGIGGFYNADTTAVSTTSTTRTNLKSYTFTASAKTNKIRVRVYAYVSRAVSGSTIYLNIDGTDVALAKVTATSSTLYIDYIGDISPGASHTIKVDGIAESGYTLYIDKVYIIAGFGLTSTTAVDIITVTLDTADTDKYVLRVSGNFVYRLGVRWWVIGNRKTAVAAAIYSSLANEVQGYYKPSAGDDGDNVVFLTIRTGDYPGDNASFTISGYVGAANDVIIITGVYVQVVLRESREGYNIVVLENGYAIVFERCLSIDGTSFNMWLMYKYIDGVFQGYISGSGTDIYWTYSLAPNNVLGLYVKTNLGEDAQGRSFISYINIIVLGV